jgi:hypothetical protein
MNIRSSSLPLLKLCPASIVPPEHKVVTIPEDAAITGTGGHKVLQHWVQAGAPDVNVIGAVAAELDIEDAEELGILCWMGWKCWLEIRHHFPQPALEVARETTRDGVTLTGHADIESVVGTQGRILDWKTGRLDMDHQWQLRAYAKLLLDNDRSLTDVYAAVCKVRDKRLEAWTWTREEIQQWWQIAFAALNHTDEFRPDAKWCRYCKRALECPARRQILSTGAALLHSTTGYIAEGWDLAAASPEQLHAIYSAAKDANVAAEIILDAVKSAVAMAPDGQIQHDGMALRLAVTNPRKIADTAKAVAVLSQGYLSHEEILAAAKLSITKIEDAVGSHAPRGQKKDAKAAVGQALADAGCIEASVSERLELRRI